MGVSRITHRFCLFAACCGTPTAPAWIAASALLAALAGGELAAERSEEALRRAYRNTVNLECDAVSEARWRQICKEEAARREGVRWLRLGGAGTTNQDLLDLFKYPNLVSVDLSDSRVDDAGVSRLAQKKSLQFIDLGGSNIGPFAPARLAALPQLSMLDVSRTRVDGRLIDALAGRPLVYLNVSETRLENSDLERLPEAFPQLRRLELAGLDADDTTLLRLSGLDYANFEAFLEDTAETTGFFARLFGGDHQAPPIENQALPRLADLNLAFTRAGPRAPLILSIRRELTHLNLAYTELNADGIRDLRRLPQLEVLSLSGTALDDDSLEYLTELPKLIALSIADTEVSDASIETLAQLEELQKLFTEGSALTPAGLVELQALRPDLQIIAGRL